MASKCQVPEEKAYVNLNIDNMEAIYDNTSVYQQIQTDKKTMDQKNLSANADRSKQFVPHDERNPGEYKCSHFTWKYTPLWLTLLLGILLIIVAVMAVVGFVLAYNVNTGWFAFFY